jgi:hypothetical protein
MSHIYSQYQGGYDVREDNIYAPPKKSNFFGNMSYIFVIFLFVVVYVAIASNVNNIEHSNHFLATNTKEFSKRKLSDNININIIDPVIGVSVHTQYEDNEILYSLEEIEKLYKMTVLELEQSRNSSINKLNDLHIKKLSSEEQYYDTFQKQVDQNYELLKDKFLLIKEKKELEEKLAGITYNLHIKNNKLHESLKKQQSIVTTKISLNKNNTELEKLIISEQHETVKKLI